jgi:hypothetical protein
MSPAESANHALSIRPTENFRIPAIIADVGAEAAKRFSESFRNTLMPSGFVRSVRTALDGAGRTGAARWGQVTALQLGLR